MDSRYRKFLAVAETGSFSAAARRLRVTQPAISLAVTSLEHGLGVRLYVRRSKPVSLTPEGEIVAEAARHMAAIVENMQEQLQTAPKEKYQVGIIDSIAHLLYASDGERPILSGLEVMVDNSRRILRDLTEGKIDLGVITGQPAELDHGLVARTTDRIDDWLATNPDSTTYHHFLELFRRKHLLVAPIFHSASMELLRDMAMSGKGTALLPRHIVQGALDDGTLGIVKTKPLYRPIWAVMRRSEGGQRARSIIAQVNQLLITGESQHNVA
jgi:DNA-binding transcriptional LysR family regulator